MVKPNAALCDLQAVRIFPINLGGNVDTVKGALTHLPLFVGKLGQPWFM